MPYIQKETRSHLIEKPYPLTPGELNYMITKMIIEYLGESPGYQRFNDALGVLTAAQLELYRRMVAPYEDVKIKENGDVYPPDRHFSYSPKFCPGCGKPMKDHCTTTACYCG